MSILIATTAAHLADDAAAVCAAANHPVMRTQSLPSRHSFATATAVLLDPDRARDILSQGYPPHPRLYLITDDDPVAASTLTLALQLRGIAAHSLPGEAEALVHALSRDTAAATPRRARVITVLGGHGGAGASTVALLLAYTAAKAHATALVDADATGGGMDVLAGAEEEPGLRWEDLPAQRGSIDGPSLDRALLSIGGVSLLTTGRGTPQPPPAHLVGTVLDALAACVDVVICDAPRADAQRAEHALQRSDHVVLCQAATVRATAATHYTLQALRQDGIHPQLVVRLPGPGGLRSSDISAAHGVDDVFALPQREQIAAHADREGIRRVPHRSFHTPLISLLQRCGVEVT